MIYDYIIAGSGFGGLSAGLLLQQKNYKVLILESHVKSGGCASDFKRISKLNPKGEFIFDVGATTLSGFENGRPLDKFLKITNLENKLKKKLIKQETGILIHLPNGKKIFRYACKEKWHEEVLKKFLTGQDDEKQKLNFKKFWDLIYKLESKAYQMTGKLKKFPPQKIKDLFKLPKNPANLNLLYYLFTDTYKILKKFNLHQNEDFMSFINQQLLITFQSPPGKVPFLFAAMGLAYPSDTYYMKGGIQKFSQAIQDEFENAGGKIKFKHRVEKTDFENGLFKVETSKGFFYSKNFISNITVWNTGDIVSDKKLKTHFEKIKKRYSEAWGAYTLYLAVEDNFEDFNTLYHQIHYKSQVTGNASIFVSLSMKNDFEKAPEGWRTITISTHLSNPGKWKKIEKEDYIKNKKKFENEIMELLNNSFVNFKNCEKKYILSGSPKTFEFYTKRYNGFVGGIPSDISKNIFSFPSSFTPLKNFYMVGDSVFPGQGSPAVILGAMNLTELIS